jgi:sec-independent protein translocase protein TatA
MPSLGPLEIFVLGAIALIVFGPQKLPEIARNVGRTIANLRKMAAEVKDEFEAELTIPEDDRIRPERERPTPSRLTPEPVQDKDGDEVLKPGEHGPGDDPNDEAPEPEPEEDLPGAQTEAPGRAEDGPA